MKELHRGEIYEVDASTELDLTSPECLRVAGALRLQKDSLIRRVGNLSMVRARAYLEKIERVLGYTIPEVLDPP